MFKPLSTAVVCALFAAIRPCAADGIKSVGPIIQITSGSSWWSEASYSPDADQYLVIWQQYGGPHVVQKARCLNANTGAFAGPEFQIAEWVGLGGVVYNPDLHCWFVVYFTDHDSGGDLYGQKIDASGNIGAAIPLVIGPGDQGASAVAYDPVNKRYLVAWTDYRDVAPNIRGRFFDSNGNPIPGMNELLLGDYSVYSQTNPVIAYNPAAGEFLVAWCDLRNDRCRTDPNENNNNYTDIYGQRVRAATGTLIGGNLGIDTPYAPGVPYVGDGWDGPGGLACNTNPASGMYGTYLLGVQKLTDFGWTTRGLLLHADGSRRGSMFNLSHPLRGGSTGVAYNPVDDTYLTTYLDADYDLSGQMVRADGQLLQNPAKMIANPDYEENMGSLAVRPRDGQYLQVTTWFENLITHDRPYILVARRFMRDVTPPEPVASFTATPGRARIKLAWTNPLDADFTATRIRYSTVTYPAGPDDGAPVATLNNAPGSTDRYVHSGLHPGTIYYYSAFAQDDVSNNSAAACASATARKPGDFDGDDDVDQSDFGVFQICLTGSGWNLAPGCEDADFDGDGDVDELDLKAFRRCFSGPGLTSKPGCSE